MKIISIFLLFLLIAYTVTTADNNLTNLSDLSSQSIKNFFNKYSSHNSSMKFDEFEIFLNKVLETFEHLEEDHDVAHEEPHDHSHGHSHDHSHADHSHNDHSHDDSHDDHSHEGHSHEGHSHDHSHDQSHHHSHRSENKKNELNFQCFIRKLKDLKEKLHNQLDSIDQIKFSSYSSIFMSDFDYCIEDVKIFFKKGDFLSNATFYEKIYAKKENWIFAFLSALIITIIGLLCYLVVPSLNALCFNYFFQFLVALAVGTLTGDSLLHLIPHAFASHDHSVAGIHDQETHNEGVYKGLGAVVGIYVFFLIEKIMQIRRARKEKQHRHDELNHKDHHDHHELHEENVTKEFRGPIISETVIAGSNANFNSGNKIYANEHVIHANKDLKYISKYLPNNKCGENIDHHDHENEIEHLHQHSENNLEKMEKKNEQDLSKLEKQSDQNRSTTELNEVIVKSHGHSHNHKYKSSREKAHHDHHKKHEKEISDIKLIAWMVLMGDGLHNFADGLAIGASFASSLTTGFGTAIAVLCHELPHEIGDFAVLRRAGVSLNRALVFNAVSGVLCMFGTLVGLIIGGFAFLSNWTFLFIAGTFLYISLVDMIPELSEDKEDDSIKNFLIQSFGILVGVGIMLAIALYEDKIIQIFR